MTKRNRPMEKTLFIQNLTPLILWKPLPHDSFVVDGVNVNPCQILSESSSVTSDLESPPTSKKSCERLNRRIMRKVRKVVVLIAIIPVLISLTIVTNYLTTLVILEATLAFLLCLYFARCETSSTTEDIAVLWMETLSSLRERTKGGRRF